MDKLPSELIDLVAAFVAPPDFESFCMSCKYVFTRSESRLAQHRKLRSQCERPRLGDGTETRLHTHSLEGPCFKLYRDACARPHVTEYIRHLDYTGLGRIDWNQDEHLQWLSELALRNPIVNASLPGMLHHLDTWFIKNETWGVEWILPFLCQNLTHLALDCSLFDECLLTLMNAIASTDQIEEQVFRALDLITAVPFRIWLWRPSGAGPLTSILVLDDLIRRASSTSCCSCALCPEKLSLLRGSRVRDVGSLEIAKAFKDVTESALEEIQFHSSYISPGSLGILLPKLPRLAGYLESHERPRGHPRGQDADWSHQATLQRLVAWKPKQLRKLTLLTAAEDCPVGVQYLEWDQIIASLKELSSLQELRIFVKWLRPRVFETLPSTVRLLGLQTWTVESIQEMKDSAMEMVEKLARGLSVRYTHSPLALEHILLSHTTPRVLRKLRKAADYSVLISENASLDFEWWDGHCTMCRHNPCQYPEERLFGFAETSSH